MNKYLIGVATFALLPVMHVHAAIVEIGNVEIDGLGQYNVGSLNQGIGSLLINNGSQFAHDNSVFIANLAGTTGEVTIDGAGSAFTQTNGFFVIANGGHFPGPFSVSNGITAGRVDVTNGGLLDTDNLRIGVENGAAIGAGQFQGRSRGQLFITGANSKVTSSHLDMQGEESFLTMSQGGALQIDGDIQTANSTITVNTGTFAAGNLRTNAGTTGLDFTNAQIDLPHITIADGIGATGTMIVRDSSLAGLETLEAGLFHGQGDIIFDNTTMTPDSESSTSFASITMGRQGTGSVTFQNGSDFNFVTNQNMHIAIGEDFGDFTGQGRVTVDNSNLSGTAANIGISLGDRGDSSGSMEIKNGGTLNLSADDSLFMTIATGAEGKLEVLNNASAVLSGNHTGFTIANEAGEENAQGRITVDNANMTMRGGNVFGSVGRNGGEAAVEIKNNGHMVMEGQAFASPADGREFVGMSVGRENSVGILRIESGGQLDLVSDAISGGYAATSDGSNTSFGRGVNAQGFLAMDNGTLTQTDSSQTFVILGREGGNGAATLSNGSRISLHDTNTEKDRFGAAIILGRDTSGSSLGASGSMTVTDSTVEIVSDNNFAGLHVGRDNGTTGSVLVSGTAANIQLKSVNDNATLRLSENSGSRGDMTITAGATVDIIAGIGARVELGRGPNTNSAMIINNGGKLNVMGDQLNAGHYKGGVRVGGTTTKFNIPENGVARMIVDGPDSMINTNGDFLIGGPVKYFDFGGGTSDARVTLRNGATIKADEGVHVGQGGVLDGSGGTIIGDLFLDGGTIAPGNSPGSLTVDGNFEVLGGVLELEFAGTGPGQFDLLNITGDFLLDTTTTLVLSFLDGFAADTGHSFDFLNIGGDILDQNRNEIGLAGLNSLNLLVEGVEGAAFSFVDTGSGGFALFADDGGTPISAVPVPAALPLLFTALAGLGIFGHRRKRAA